MCVSYGIVLVAPGCDFHSAPARTETPNSQSSVAPPPGGQAQPAAAQHVACPNDATGAVRSLGPTHCEVPRAVAFGDGDCLLARPQLSLATANGRVVGFRHDSVASRSLYALCGIQSGDVWTKLNGVALDGPDAALEVYPRLRESDRLTIDLLRGTTPLTVEIELR
jgi:general secretion pathway protein C